MATASPAARDSPRVASGQDEDRESDRRQRAREEREALHARESREEEDARTREAREKEAEVRERDRAEDLCQLFTFDSDTLRGGTGEVRAWITVAAACGRAGRVVEYLVSHHAKVGLGFAVWPWEGEG